MYKHVSSHLWSGKNPTLSKSPPLTVKHAPLKSNPSSLESTTWIQLFYVKLRCSRGHRKHTPELRHSLEIDRTNASKGSGFWARSSRNLVTSQGKPDKISPSRRLEQSMRWILWVEDHQTKPKNDQKMAQRPYKYVISTPPAKKIQLSVSNVFTVHTYITWNVWVMYHILWICLWCLPTGNLLLYC